MKRMKRAHASAFTLALKRIRYRGTAGASSSFELVSEVTPFTRIGGVCAVSFKVAVTVRPAASFNPGRNEI